MRRLRTTMSAIGAVLLCAAIAIYWHTADDDPVADGTPLPEPPVVPENAVPLCVSSAPLPAAEGTYEAKPVVAADREHRIVVAQDLLADDWRLVQWHSAAGQRWAAPRTLENPPTASRFVGDPWVETDRRGRFYLVDTFLSGLVFWRSTDFGRTWKLPLTIAQRADRPVMGASRDGKHLVIAASLGEGTGVVTTTPLDANDPQFAAKIAASTRFSTGVFWSQDQGRNWRRLPGPLKGWHAIPFSVIIDDEGRIASSWIAAQGEQRNSRSVVCSTTDHGQSWSETELVRDLQPDRNHPFNGERFPVLALSSTGTLHVAYVESLAKGLAVRQSDDWNRWANSRRLSDEAVPEGPAEEVRMPAIAALGPMVHVSWIERRNGRWQMYYRGSRDRGQSWSKRLRLSVPHASSTLIDQQGFRLTSDDDQTCVADDGAGTVHVVWAVRGAGPSVPSRIWHARIKWQEARAQGGAAQ
jgi:hypothetical protein